VPFAGQRAGATVGGGDRIDRAPRTSAAAVARGDGVPAATDDTKNRAACSSLAFGISHGWNTDETRINASVFIRVSSVFHPWLKISPWESPHDGRGPDRPRATPRPAARPGPGRPDARPLHLGRRRAH